MSLAAVVMLAASAFFMTMVIIPREASLFSAVNVIAFAAPAFWATRRWLGWRDAVILWTVLGVFAVSVETFAIATGQPYGNFYYSDLLGYKLFGLTPWTVSLAWTPLVLASYVTARRAVRASGVIGSLLTVAIGVAGLVILDLVIDPGAVRVGFWRYEGGGDYYGVPLTNYIGWLFSGTAAMAIVEVFVRMRRPLLPAPVQAASSAFFILVLWTAVAGFAQMWWPIAIGIAALVALIVFFVSEYYAFDEMLVLCDDSGRPVATMPKGDVHTSETPLHLAFSVFVFNEAGEVLLQRRAFTKKTWPGVWSNSCCGHLMLHEKVEAAAKRRLKDELGMGVADLRVALPDYRYRAEKDGVVENEICPVLVARAAGQPRPNADEVAEVRWMDWDEFLKEVGDPDNGYSPWAIEESRLLEESGEIPRRIG